VDDAVDIRMSCKHLVESGFIGNVKFAEIRPLSTDEFDAIDGLLRGVVEVVRYHDFVVGLKQRKRCERTDVPSAAAATSMKAPSVDLAHTYPVTSTEPTVMTAI